MSVLEMPPVTLEMGGLAYAGWTSVEIDRAVSQAVGSFALDLAAKGETGAEDWPIKAGEANRVLIGSEVLITGYSDKVSRSIRPEERSVSVSGRDKALDMVDCSAMNSPGSWKNQKLDAIARALAVPFGISIVITGDTGAPFKKFALQQGETAFAAIERLARYRGLVVYSPGDGTLRVGNAATGERTGQLVEGVNVVEADSDDDVSERFSQYVVKGQASGDDSRNGKIVSQVKGAATDPAVTRYRPLLVLAEEQSDTAALTRRAKWEASVRSGRGKPLIVTVHGWLTDEGKVWQPGALSWCDIPSCNVRGDLLVERVRIARNNEEGTITQLSLVPPEAWTQLAEKEGS